MPLACDVHPMSHNALDFDRLSDATGAETLIVSTCTTCNSTHFHAVKTEKTQRWRLMCAECLAEIESADELLT